MLNRKRVFIEISPGIGDLIMATPVFRRIKELFPLCVLTVASRNANSLETVKRLPYIDSVFPVGEKMKNIPKIIEVLKKQDYVVLNSYFPLLAWLSWMLRVPHRAGNCKEKYARMGLFTCPMPYSNKKEWEYYQTDYYAEKLGSGLGTDLSVSDYRCDVSSPTNHEKTHIQELLRRNGVMGEYIVLAPFGNSGTSMDTRMIEAIIGFLAQKKYFCVIIGGSSDLVSQILEETSYRQIINLCGQTSVMAVIALLQGARLLVSMDSGPMHIGCAVGCETVAVFGSGVMSEWTPKEHCHSIGMRLPCSGPCKLTPDKCRDHKCIRLFPENKLFDEIQEALSRTRQAV